MHENSQHITQLNAWLLRASVDYFQLYVNLWIGFNSWFVSESGIERNDRQGIEWVKNQNHLKELYENGHLVIKIDINEIKFFLESNPLPEDMRNGWDGRLTEDRSWSEIVEFLYQARCNLFHGRKNPNSYADRQIVRMAYECLYEIFNFIVLESEGVTTHESIMQWKMLDEKSDSLLSEYRSEVLEGSHTSKERARELLKEWRRTEQEKKIYLNKYIKTEWVDG